MKTKVVDTQSLRRFKKQTNFFETPDVLADKMASLVDDVGLNARILEPSAGRGALIKAVHKAIHYKIAPVDFCETHQEFAAEVARLQTSQVGSDFLQYHPGPIYDAVIMNPPYQAMGAERHVSHAWNCIRPGGKIVALVGGMAAQWMDDEFEGYVFVRELFAKGTFRETSIATCLFLIHKPLYQ